MPYQPIEHYGLIGNMHTAALVGIDGSIDWMCIPRFDSPSVFAAILDDQKGGRFRIGATGENIRQKQHYWPNTNVLITRFLHADGIGEIADYMPVGGETTSPVDQLVRRLRVVHGKMPFRLECRPAFDYARSRHTTFVNDRGARFDATGLSLGLVSSVPLRRDGDGVVADFVLAEGVTRNSSCDNWPLVKISVSVPARARRKSDFGRPLPIGSGGSRSAPITAAGGKSCSARHWPSNC
jgi:hypothetical protein